MPPPRPYSKLKVQWEEKVGVLGGLEESMGKLQESFSQREAALVREKEAALEELRLVGVCPVYELLCQWIGITSEANYM